MRSTPIARLLVVPSVIVVAGACADDPVSLAPLDAPNFGKSAKFEAANNHVVSGLPSDLASRVEALRGTLLRTHQEIGIAVVGGLSDKAAAQLAGSRGISDVTRDVLVQWTPEPDGMKAREASEAEGHVVSDPTTAFFFPCQWNMTQTNCPVGSWVLWQRAWIRFIRISSAESMWPIALAC